MNSGKSDCEEQKAKELELAHQKLIDSELSSDMQVASIDDAQQLLKLIHLIKGNPVASDSGSNDGSTQKPTALDSTIQPEKQDSVQDILPPQIGRFEVGEMLGKGGFGIVVRGLDKDLNREVALKIPGISSLVSTDARSRFVTEAKATAALNHPHLVTLYESGQFGPIYYLASELIEGPTFAEWLKQNKRPILPEHAASIAISLTKGLQHAHERGIIHRDIKPSNIFLAGNDLEAGELDQHVRLGDFGLAKFLESEEGQTQTGAMIGTPAYMAPEQTRSEDAQVATDIWAVGILLYEMVCGETPFHRGSMLETVKAVQFESPFRQVGLTLRFTVTSMRSCRNVWKKSHKKDIVRHSC